MTTIRILTVVDADQFYQYESCHQLCHTIFCFVVVTKAEESNFTTNLLLADWSVCSGRHIRNLQIRKYELTVSARPRDQVQSKFFPQFLLDFFWLRFRGVFHVGKFVHTDMTFSSISWSCRNVYNCPRDYYISSNERDKMRLFDLNVAAGDS